MVAGSGYARDRVSKRDRYEPSDPKPPAWAVPPDQVAKLPPCKQCGRPFRLDAARGVAGGLVTLDLGGGELAYYHGYPEVPGKGSCYAAAERAGFP